jgi:predicted nucleotidyltransferase component of viral defense system
MIPRDEIEAQGNALGVHTANVERDYVFGWLLKAFYENSYLAPLLIFKGGNCMRKAYYPNTRFSSDLDFSVMQAVDSRRFQAEINRCCEAAQAACGVTFETEKNTFVADRMIDSQRQAYKGRVYFRDFYGNEGQITIAVRLDVTEFDNVLLPTVQRDLIHPYSDGDSCRASVKCMALEELLANKLKCLLQRRHSFDLYDFVYAAFFERAVDVDRALVLRTFLRKTIYERSPGSAKQVLLGLPLTFFKAAWEKYIVCPTGSRFEFGRVTEAFASAIEGIFGNALPRRWGPDPFFPAEYRNLILEAGSKRQLMRLTYDGREREVEPYSLAYKRRKDGEACEYFYVYDRTGGHQSAPGIRSLFHHKMQNLIVTEETFEPRFKIELSKAGEAPKNQYFGKSFGIARIRTRVRALGKSHRRAHIRNPFALSYTVQCPYCLKTFKRTKASTILHPHKDSNGYRCSARRGYLV